MKRTKWFIVEVKDGLWHSRLMNEKQVDDCVCPIEGPFENFRDSADAVNKKNDEKELRTK